MELFAECGRDVVHWLANKPGFRDYGDGFHIDEYQLGKDHWVESFASLVTIMMPLLDEGVDVWRPVQAAVLPDGRYQIATQNSHPEDERWAFNTGDVVLCETRDLEGQAVLIAVALESISDGARKDDGRRSQ